MVVEINKMDVIDEVEGKYYANCESYKEFAKEISDLFAK
jgi:sulfate adenylyltransferase subunit 1 (EFTu-like GTPase family)